jgi:hypothetical protein
MSEYPQPGLHPDPDTLNAFIEGVLPEHERLTCLAHFADCAACREVVYLAQEPEAPSPNPIVERAAWWKRFLKPIPALGAAAITGILVLSVALYRMEKPAPSAPVTMVARSVPQSVNEPAAAPALPTRKTAPKVPNPAPSRAMPAPVPEFDKSPSFSPQPPLRLATPAPVAPQPIPQTSFLEASPNIGLLNTKTGIAGRITDPTGAAIAGAAVTAKPASDAPAANTVTDKSGMFLIGGLRPGEYELQVTQPGFQSARKQVEIRPGQLARADSSLSIGSAAESVSVAASASVVNTESGSPVKNTLAMPNVPLFSRMAVKAPATIGTNSVSLPSKLAAVTMATKNKVRLAADSAGTLYRTDDGGRKWELVEAVWPGKVVELTSESTTFRLKTDTGAAWLSRDGKQWVSAAPGR